ncbi:uncharacterized protein L203_102775 [Cryptococcus depauperatus CBS 7841]|uniref:GATA-type domain-containing protein n=1 Tax=Cryptococcus depauperatus CBS 7841 TaxID=1295531 RepID=A0AAJ8JSC6_9TREE
MAPSPGKIHSLPIKVLYSIDSSPHSYVTVLGSPQDVYVHLKSNQQDSGNGYSKDIILGSCLLKAIARAICFASPECIPNQSDLDFSVYNLNPSQCQPAPRAFTQSDSRSSWTGRGFLSWVLSEPSPGSTTIKGTLVREYEFSSTQSAPEGGLEALVAAANSSQGDEQDGKGWGLEVSVCLRQVNPEGKTEFKGRREFEESLQRGVGTAESPRLGTEGMAVGILSSPAGQRFSQPNIERQVPLGQRQGSTLVQQMEAARHVSRGSDTGPDPAGVSIARITNQSQPSSSRPSSAIGNRPSSSTSISRSSLVGNSSSYPPSRPSSTHQTLPPPPPPQLQGHPSHLTRNENSGPLPVAITHQRQVTPPTLSKTKSPPPSTPSRKHLHALLRADGLMSPELARHLASNPVLRNLLKAVPSNSGALMQLRSIAGINVGTGQSKNSEEDGKGRTKDREENGDSPPEPTTPTPSVSQVNASRTVQPPRRHNASIQSHAQVQHGLSQSQGKGQESGKSAQSVPGGCFNCGTMTSTCWRVRKVKDGSPRKVCDDCGVYFNEHKKMRPPELWSPKSAINGTNGNKLASNSRSPHTDSIRRKPQVPELDGPASNLRSSPRHHSSPRSQSSYNSRQHQTFPPPPLTPTGSNKLGESPRKKRKGVAPSPRMATRANTKAGGGQHSELASEVFGFSPRTIMSDQPTPTSSTMSVATPAINRANGIKYGHSQSSSVHLPSSNPPMSIGSEMKDSEPPSVSANLDDFDLDAFLLSMDHHLPYSQSTNMNGNGDQVTQPFDLDAIFGKPAGQEGGELSQEILDLLAEWEGDARNCDQEQDVQEGGISKNEEGQIKDVETKEAEAQTA